MGAWSTYPVNLSVLQGAAPSEAFTAVEANVAQAARLLVRDLARPRVAKYFAGHGGDEGFYDACAGAAELAPALDAALGYAYLYRFYADQANRGGRGRHDAAKAAEYFNPSDEANRGQPSGLLVVAIRGFAELAGDALARKDPSAATTGSHAFRASAPPRTFDEATLSDFVGGL